MAVDMLMKIDTVDGEGQDAKHKKEIDVLSWGISNSGSADNGSGAGAGGQCARPHFQPIKGPEIS